MVSTPVDIKQLEQDLLLLFNKHGITCKGGGNWLPVSFKLGGCQAVRVYENYSGDWVFECDEFED